MDKKAGSPSKHFEIQSISEGILVAMAKDGGAAICNSAIIDLGGQIVVFDTFLTPQAALDLRQIAIEYFDRSPQLVINSHYHNDHIWGNQVFASDSQIISSTCTRELIASEGIEELKWYTENSAKQLEVFRKQFEKANKQQEQMILWIGYYEGLVEAIPHLSVCKPTITFNHKLEINGTKRTAKLIAFEGAHTKSDSILYLPQEGVVLMSDLLFVKCHPYLAEGDPLLLMKALKELTQFDAIYFVPGHGPIGTIEDIRALIRYIEYCLETAQSLVKEGSSLENKIAELQLAEEFRLWRLPQFFHTNIGSFCQRLKAGN